MANFNGTARSNYFKVKDVEAFKAWVETIPDLVCWEREGLYAIRSEDFDTGCWPSTRYDDEDEDLNLTGELAEHLAEGEVAVLMEAGAEKLRYISGWAVAVNHKGEEVSISLYNIYDLAEKTFGVRPTDASY